MTPWLLALVLLLVVLPLSVYLCVSLGRFAYLRTTYRFFSDPALRKELQDVEEEA